ncbi:response regulator transcription factor [Cellulomonas persica]|uniref:DNA-binding response regulator n=1 Tax=Cellulomonas persica TaxID=76861 RepID=A0A510UPW4_9CELL|nr:DNA-binding response regulator [Cellulomonas persica]
MTIEPLRRAPAARTSATSAAPGAARPAAAHHMCVVVTELADGDGTTLVQNLRRRGNQRVVVLTRRASRSELCTLLAGGLRGAVASSTAPSLTRTPVAPPPAPPLPELTSRELSVLRLVAQGRSNRLIGEELGLSALTVKSHLARISRKFGTGDRAHLVAMSFRGGLLD